ncbi:MAG: protease modulator HflC [Limisphaerales bacterium]|nr:HflC protein [Pedosphaera sp.]MBL6843631.1 protease modulator HflC [Verrucomicrobiae bacterium]RZO71095.1 MAG: protease modulator HflC [Limisphaerales bacterium]HAQ98764.1 protease modulator HflC [Verrucomicrobiales bacterium]HBP56743.1 protease modulator HflC [Verrucomicrobiales bacterium]|tara:strand:- start:197 stop:1162 length:966 start_codon:yes stop_codon:yes gene_type:complete
MQKAAGSFMSLLAIVAIFVAYNAAYTIHETEQVLITQFGKPVGDPITKSGLHFKIPFIQEVNQIDNRFLAWDGKPNEMPTKDKTYILVDTFARWRILDAKQYFLRLRDERSAQSRLNDILGSETRNAIAKHELIEIVRTTKDREPIVDEVLSDAPGNVGVLYEISKGRALIEKEIFELAGEKLKDFGIELLDIRFKRINYNETVRKRIYERMISERQQIAERFRSEGEGEAARIIGKKERDLQEIESEAYKQIQKIQGDADAKATEIYASAYNQSKQSVDFYEFVKTLETYEEVIDSETTMILSTDSDLYRYLKHSIGNTD